MTDEVTQPQDDSFEDAFNELTEDDQDEQLQEGQEEEGLREVDPEPEPEPEPQTNAELERYKQEIQQWQHKYNSDLGRQNALQRKIQELENENNTLRTSNPQGSGMSDKEWNELQQDFPEIARAVETKLKSITSQYESKIQALEQNITPIQQQIAQQAEEAFISQQYKLLEEQHADWKDIAGSEEFKTWVAQQPVKVRELVSSKEAADAAYLIGSYKRDVMPQQQTSQSELKQRRERQLRQAQTVPSRGGRVRGNEPPDDDYEAAFDFFASKDARR